MTRTERADPLTAVELEIRRQQIIARQVSENLPSFDEHVAGSEEIGRRLDGQLRLMAAAVRDCDEVNLDKGLEAWIKICQEVNENLAEQYRQANPDPETWELRYFKWMVRVIFVRFDSPLGEFYLVPRKPRRRPKAKYWYTADEMIDMLHTGVANVINAFGALPIRPTDLSPPGPGEQHVHIDLTGPEPRIKCELGRMP